MSEQDRNDLGPQVQGRMGFDERETLMYYLLRHPGVCVEARQVLTPEHFTEPYELIWALLWRSCMDLYTQTGHMPPQMMLETDALSRIAEHPGEVPADGVTEMRKLIDYAFELDTAAMYAPGYESYGFELLHKFLKERHWIDPVRRFIQEIGDATPVDVPALLESFKVRYSQVQSAAASAIQDFLPQDESWQEDSLNLQSTGLAFLDHPMGGGVADGEVYGLLGTFGSGKTMLSCNIMAEATTRCVTFAGENHLQPRHCFSFVYETPPNDIRKRVISYHAQIRLDHLNTGPYHVTLSRRGRRHAYEEEMFPNDPRGEWERYNDTRYIWETLHIGDMRGPRENPKAGSGGERDPC